MKYLQLVPYVHRQQPIVKASFAFLKPHLPHLLVKSLANIKSPLDQLIEDQSTGDTTVTAINI